MLSSHQIGGGNADQHMRKMRGRVGADSSAAQEDPGAEIISVFHSHNSDIL